METLNCIPLTKPITIPNESVGNPGSDNECSINRNIICPALSLPEESLLELKSLVGVLFEFIVYEDT